MLQVTLLTFFFLFSCVKSIVNHYGIKAKVTQWSLARPCKCGLPQHKKAVGLRIESLLEGTVDVDVTWPAFVHWWRSVNSAATLDVACMHMEAGVYPQLTSSQLTEFRDDFPAVEVVTNTLLLSIIISSRSNNYFIKYIILSLLHWSLVSLNTLSDLSKSFRFI